jgi:hypothetical protein
MKFTKNKTYYSGIVYEWNLPTGHTCPSALECLVKVNRETGKFLNSSNLYRCYAANAERWPSVRNYRWNNFEYVKKGFKPILPSDAISIRIHASGDFFSQKYFDMWIELCEENPHVEFWAYTKSLNYWVKRLEKIPSNLVLTASYGGKFDNLIKEYNLKHAIVIKNKELAIDMPIDFNDDEARKSNTNFYLLDNFIR